MSNSRELSPEMRNLLQARTEALAAPAVSELDDFLEGLNELFHPDRVNAQFWHCRTQEEFDEARDALEDPEDDLRARPDLDGGNDTFFTDRN